MTASPSTLVGRTSAATVAVLLVALVAAGAVTGALLHAAEVRATDKLLLAAALAPAGGGDRWEAEGVVAPVHVSFARDGDLPQAWVARLVAGGRPVFVATSHERIALVELEEDQDAEWEDGGDEGEEDADEERAEHAVSRIRVARTVRPTIDRTVGPFALAYGVAAGAVVVLGAAVQYALVRRAVRPLHLARQNVRRAIGAGVGARVDVDGPEEVRDLLEAVEALLRRLDDAFATQARFTSLAAHELRTPVAAMLGELDVALRRPRDPAGYVEVLSVVRGEVVRLASLVDGLLLLTRIDAGHAEQARTLEHAGVLAERAARVERDAIVAAGGALSVQVDADPEVHAHEALVVAALSNLLRNARVHAPGASVHLAVTAPEPGRVRYTVHDDGPGLGDLVRKDAEALFTRATATGRAGGLHLGLPLAREIARRHGGDCRALPSERGATFVLELPTAT